MHQILEYLVRYCAFLWKGARYRIVDSVVSTSFGGNALLVLESTALRMRFVSDRGQLLLDFQAPADSPDKESDWRSADLIRRLLTGERQQSGVLEDESYARFVEQHLPEIERRFTDDLAGTKKELDRLAKLRSKELFG